MGWQTVTVSGVGSFVSVVYCQIQKGRFCLFSRVFLGVSCVFFISIVFVIGVTQVSEKFVFQ